MATPSMSRYFGSADRLVGVFQPYRDKRADSAVRAPLLAASLRCALASWRLGVKNLLSCQE